MKTPSQPIAAAFAALLLTAGGTARAQNPGPVTPSEVTVHVTSVSLQGVDQSFFGLVNQPFDFTFRRRDPDFAGVPLKDAEVQTGRYAAISLCFKNRQEVLFDGTRYDGRDGALLHHGDLVYSLGGAALSAQAGVATPIGVGAGDQQWCSITSFRAPLCITSGGGGCQPGDTRIDAQAVAGPDGGSGDGGSGVEASLQINLLLDMYHSVMVDADSGAVQSAPSPFVTLGSAGAGIHLAAYDAPSGTAADATLLFSPERELIAAFVSKRPGAGGMNGLCDGQSTVIASAVPDGGAALPWAGPVFIGLFDDSGTGGLQVPAMGGACRDITDPTQCVADSINVFTGLLQEPGHAAAVTCIAPADARPPYLGYQYRHGDHSRGDGSTVQLPIVRVVDPGNLFGVCRPGAASAVQGHPGTCASSGTVDGY